MGGVSLISQNVLRWRVTAIPAATLILCRKAGESTEHLFVERSGKMRFAAGAVVFPGGRVDDGDHLLGLRSGVPDVLDAAARVAAIRETIEEAGLCVGVVPTPDEAATHHIRAGLLDGRVFADLLAAQNRVLDLDVLSPFARWAPGFREQRVFDTRFYLADAQGPVPQATVDETENVAVFWAAAQQLLERADRGEVRIIFPTRRNLERLAALGSYDAARAQAERIAPELIVPKVEVREGASYLCIPEGRGYPVTAELFDTVRRG